MGGLGKTTLAKKVYKHLDVKRYFDAFVWICVSQKWETEDILQRILVKLEGGSENKWSTEDELISRLLLVQQRTKCLIVLDDIWTTDVWDCIKAAFPRGQNGSKILLTTRITEVASHIGRDQGFQHQPRLLNGDESWELLRRKALQQTDIGNGNDVNALAILGKKMVEYCGGLPLAVIVLGGILSTKNGSSEWEIVHQNIKSILWKRKSFGKGKGDLEKILGMSYQDLPFELKPCFLYLGFFPEEAEIIANNLYQLWMAEGLVLQDRGSKKSIMELAELYLGELGQRGIVQLQTSDLPGYKRRIESCRLQDLMRDLCLLEAERENFMCSVKYSIEGKGTDPRDSLPVSSFSKLRRLVIAFDDEADTSTCISKDKEKMKYLRMVRYEIPLEHVEKKAIKSHLSIFDDFDMLRVLSFKVQGDEFKLPKAIGGLIHLRYLSTRGCEGLVKLPSSLGNLKHLQTLDLRESVLPPFAQNIFLKMTRLIFLYLPSCKSRSGWGKIRLSGLDKLEILTNFNDEIYETKDLIKLINLRVLKVNSCRGHENLEMIEKYAQNNKRLEYVSIGAFCDFRVNKEKGSMVLKQLLFGRSIRRLVIHRPIWEFPEYEPNMSSNILELYIKLTSLKVEEIINTLEQFTCLRKLCLYSAKGKELCFHATGFPQLSHLQLDSCREMETWVVEEGAMPKLRALNINDCPKLKAIPDGLRFISSLETLYFYNMPQEFKEIIQTSDGRKGEDFHKVMYHLLDCIRRSSPNF